MLKYFCIYFVLIFSILTKETFVKRKLVEDFESISIQKENFQIHSNSQNTLEVWKSDQLVSPDILSEHSLVIRIKESSSKIPYELILKNPYQFEELILNFEFSIYSNNTNGELYFYFDDSKFNRHKVLITNLNFEGWKNIKIPLHKLIVQKNYVVFKNAKTSLVGFLIQTGDLSKSHKETIIAIDDIFIHYKDKILFP